MSMDYQNNLEEVREMSDAPTLILMFVLFVIFVINMVFFDIKY